MGTPLTPTPTKLFKSLNIKTPETEIKKSLFSDRHDLDREEKVDRLDLELDAKRTTKSESRNRKKGDVLPSKPKGHFTKAAPSQNARHNRNDWKKQRRKEREDRKDRMDQLLGPMDPLERKEEERPAVVYGSSWQDIELTTPVKGAKRGNTGNPVKGSKEAGVSAFQQLQKATRALPLPLKWTILIQKFNALESTLALYQRKSMFYVHHQNIVHSVRQIVKKSFTQRDLQEIVSIVPDFYHLQWTPFEDKVTHKKGTRLTVTAMDYDPFTDQQIDDPFNRTDLDSEDIVQKQDKDRMNEIGIRFLKVTKLREREKVFRVRLVQYLCHHHQQFLEENVLVEFDPLQTGKWHRTFDLENVTDIEISPLPQREKKGVDEIERMIKEQKEKMDAIVQREMEKAKEAESLKNDPMMGKAMVVPKHLSHLSPTMVARIRAKERGKTMVSTKSLCPGKKGAELVDDEQYRLQQLPYLVTLLRGIYVAGRKSSMACNDLIALVKKRHRNHHVVGGEIWKQLQILGNLKSRFFVIKQGPMVKVARLNKKVSTREVLDEIQRKIKKN